MSAHTLLVGYFSTTESFRGINQHVAVMRADGGMVAVTGPSVGPGAFDALDLARLFAAAPDLLAALEKIWNLACTEGDIDAETDWESVRAAIAKAVEP